MNPSNIEILLKKLAIGSISVDEVLNELKLLPYADLDFAKIDTHRQLRQGFCEVVFCPGKTPSQVTNIVKVLLEQNTLVIATKATCEFSKEVLAICPSGNYLEDSKIMFWGSLPEPKNLIDIEVGLVTAGTADISIAEEAKVFLQALDLSFKTFYDVGVAGIHRLMYNFNDLNACQVLIVAAGMDGALPSVIGGLTSNPVIAIPTSIGYGSSFQGLSALLSMLNSCANGITVVNIDNGYGAAMAAYRILKKNR